MTTLLPVFFLASFPAHAIEVVVEPFLQSAQPDEIWVVWETDEEATSLVHYGLTEALGLLAEGTTHEGSGSSRIHDVWLSGLEPETRYYYQVETGDQLTEMTAFTTPPEPSAERSFRLVAMSDMQKDNGNPDKFEEVVHDGVVAFVEQEFGPNLDEEVAMTLIPGDLVVNGWAYSQWENDYFRPSAILNRQVPVYPVYGNHEADAPHFASYFHLPDNGTPGYEDHWWFVDYSNLRVIGLDSNSAYRIDAQLDWLDEVLEDACHDVEIDFVFAELHHPHLSELWLDGETEFTGDVIERLENFSTDCFKPSIHFFGHTHGYSRGQSRDHQHVWVNVATAGGNIDYWGEYAQGDYKEITRTQDEWGFVVIDVDAGEDPQFRLRRVSRGNEDVFRDNEVRDDLTIRQVNTPPSSPVGQFPAGEGVPPECRVLQADPYLDADGDPQGAAHWQLDWSCDFTDPEFEGWVQHENWYGGVDTQAEDDLTNYEMPWLEAEQAYCWRVRDRDQGLVWSDWSDPVDFTTSEALRTENLLTNPGAEDGLEGWETAEGIVESLGPKECGSVEPHAGDRLFGVGGVCEESAYGQAVQRVDVSAYADAFDAGGVWAMYQGHLRSYSGSDRPELRTVFYDADMTLLGLSPWVGTQASSWTQVMGQVEAPAGTRFIDFVMAGTRNSGTDNDSYHDDVGLHLLLESPDCAMFTAGTETTTDTTWTTWTPETTESTTSTTTTTTTPSEGGGPDESNASDSGCGCATSPSPVWALGWLTPWWLRRRRGGVRA